ncbi:MAG: hypothetical protein KKG75_02670 [Nanoarchaeota archaeon]|nr:hypothetical protein [Nanoarchaeota archaeon]
MIKDRWFYFPVAGLLVIFVVKFISFLKIINYFPLNNYVDLSLKLSELYLLSNYGFHFVVPHWYNGFKLFEIYPPGWYFFSLPIYWVTNNLQITTLISLILMLTLGFLASWLIFKKISKKIIFFVFFFMNPIMIDYIFFIGRFPELFAWVVYLFIFYLVFRYKDKILDKKGFILFIIFTSIIIISHQYVAILALFLIFLLFLIKPKKEKILIAFMLLVVLLVTSFFWVDFLKVMIDSPYAINPTAYQKDSLLGLHSIISFNTVVLLAWFGIFYFYKKQFINFKKEKIFFYPLFILSILIITRIITLTPLFNEVPPNAYNLFFLSLSLFMLFKIKFPDNFKKIIILGLLLVPIFTAILDFEIRPERQLEYTDEQIEIMKLFPKIESKYIFINKNELYEDSLIAIATTKYNLYTPLGLYSGQLPIELEKEFETINNALKNKDCELVVSKLKDLEVKNIISYKNSCDLLKNCNLNLESEGNYSCLFTI